MWLGESIWKDAWNIMKPTCCNCDRKNKAWSYVLARLGTSWHVLGPDQMAMATPESASPNGGAFQRFALLPEVQCLLDMSCFKLYQGHKMHKFQCEEMRRDVKWCETQVYHSCTKLKWCLSLTSKWSHICGFPFLDVHPARAWDTSVSTVSTYRTVVERWFTSPSDKNSPSHPLPENCSLWISV